MWTMQAGPVLGACKGNSVQHIIVLGQVVADATLTFHDSVLYGFFFPFHVISSSISPEAGSWITYDRIFCRNKK